MQRQEHLVTELKKQRQLLDELIATINKADHLDTLSRTYDKTTRNIEKNLLELRKSFLKNKNQTGDLL